MGRQWERQLLLPFSFYIDAKVLLFFELAKFNLECEPHGQKCGTGGRAGRIERVGRRVGQVGERAARAIMGQVRQVGQVGQVRQVGQVGELFGYRSLIVRLSFAHRSLFLYCSLRFFNFYIF